MSLQTLTLVPVNSSGWVDVFDSGRSVTFKENSSGNLWQGFGIPSLIPTGWQIVGAVVRLLAGSGITAGVYDGPPNCGQVARVYQPTLAQITGNAPQVYDGNAATYYGDAVSQSSNSAIAALHDLGSQRTVGRLTATYQAVSGASVTYALDSSTDGVTWTPVAGTGGSLTGTGANATLDVSFTEFVARWFRLSFKTTSAAPYLLRIAEYQLFTGTL